MSRFRLLFITSILTFSKSFLFGFDNTRDSYRKDPSRSSCTFGVIFYFCFVTKTMVCFEAELDGWDLNMLLHISRNDTHLPATLLAEMFCCLATQKANQPVTWQQLHTFRLVKAMKTTCWSLKRALEWGFKWLWPLLFDSDTEKLFVHSELSKD